MKKLLLLISIAVAVNTQAQTAPKVVFTGDYFTLAWQTTPQFTANQNWIGAGLTPYFAQGSATVLADFQTNVISRHPAFVHIMTGESDLDFVHDAVPLGYVWDAYTQDIEKMVAMARAANIKVILGNVTTDLKGTQATQYFNEWLQRYAVANNIPVVNYHDALCQCHGGSDVYAGSLSYPLDPTQAEVTGPPNDAGYALVTQMALTAVQTYGLSTSGGYLSNVETRTAFESGDIPRAQVNNVSEGEYIQFTAQAKWTDGKVRPMFNQPYEGVNGTWSSTNPNVMTIDGRGLARAYQPGTARIWFVSANGKTFSPWDMTVTQIYP